MQRYRKGGNVPFQVCAKSWVRDLQKDLRELMQRRFHVLHWLFSYWSAFLILDPDTARGLWHTSRP
jgi:hypothetical protein